MISFKHKRHYHYHSFSALLTAFVYTPCHTYISISSLYCTQDQLVEELVRHLNFLENRYIPPTYHDAAVPTYEDAIMHDEDAIMQDEDPEIYFQLALIAHDGQMALEAGYSGIYP